MNELLPVLAIETSDTVCSACVYLSEDKYFESNLNLKNSHSEKIFEVIESVLKLAGIVKEEIKTIAISIGPGSFTGLRIGLAAAKGLSQSLQIPLITVPTFEALALQIMGYLSEGSEFIISNKVGKDEVYYAKFQIKLNNYIFKEHLKIVPVSNLNIDDETKVFGNFLCNFKNTFVLSAPSAKYIAKWAINFGTKIGFEEIDFVEPEYLKEFVVKEKKI